MSLMTIRGLLLSGLISSLLLLVAFCALCWSASDANNMRLTRPKPSGEEVMGSGYYLTDLQTFGSMIRAMVGDGDAALRLYKSYAFGPAYYGQDTRSRAIYWLQMAAENGNEYAQNRLIKMAVSNFRYDQHASRLWLQEVNAKGWKGTKQALSRVDELEARWKRSPILRASPSLDLDEDLRQAHQSEVK